MEKKFLAFVFVFLFLNLSFGDELANQLADFDSGLDAKVFLRQEKLAKSPQTVIADITVANHESEPMLIYLLRQGEDGWKIVNLLGALSPNAKTSFELEIQVQYEKKTLKKTRYAIVGRSNNGLTYGSFFELNEDWSEYEKEIKDNLSKMVLLWVPSIAFVLILLSFFVVGYAFKSKSPEAFKGEYTLKSLFLPKIEGRPFEEKIADLIMHPFFLLAEVLCVAALVYVIFFTLNETQNQQDTINILLLSAIGSFAVPFIYFAAAWYLEKHEEGKPLRLFVGMFVWGMFSAFLSLIISSTIIGELSAYSLAPYILIGTMLVSPVVEEIMKGLGILFMSGHHDYNDALTGILLGFTCGAGFAFVENWFYFSFKTNPFDMGIAAWVMLILYRSFFNTLAHGCFTAAISAPIGYARGVKSLRSVARMTFIPGLFLAIALHSIYNISAFADSFVFGGRAVPFYIFNPMLSILLATAFFLVLVFAVIDEKKRAVYEKAVQPSASK